MTIKKIMIILFFSVIITSGKIFAQTKKVYTGSYENGKSVYEYYENANMERIFHGKFTYKDDYHSIEGNFKDGLKHGSWLYSVNSNDGRQKTKLESIYKNGLPDGKWLFNYSKNLADGKIVESEKRITKFNNGYYTGNFLLEQYNIYDRSNCFSQDKKKKSIYGKFDNDGLMDSVWTIVWKTKNNVDFESIYKFKKGVLYASFTRDKSTGSIIERFDSLSFVNKVFDNLDSINNLSLINNVYYSIYDVVKSGSHPIRESECQIDIIPMGLDFLYYNKLTQGNLVSKDKFPNPFRYIVGYHKGYEPVHPNIESALINNFQLSINEEDKNKVIEIEYYVNYDDGKVSKISIVKSVNPEIDSEIIRLIKLINYIPAFEKSDKSYRKTLKISLDKIFVIQNS